MGKLVHTAYMIYKTILAGLMLGQAVILQLSQYQLYAIGGNRRAICYISLQTVYISMPMEAEVMAPEITYGKQNYSNSPMTVG